MLRLTSGCILCPWQHFAPPFRRNIAHKAPNSKQRLSFQFYHLLLPPLFLLARAVLLNTKSLCHTGDFEVCLAGTLELSRVKSVERVPFKVINNSRQQKLLSKQLTWLTRLYYFCQVPASTESTKLCVRHTPTLSVYLLFFGKRNQLQNLLHR